jgi:hypothetical protein
MHELKKREAATAKLQEQLRSVLGEKELTVRNTIEATKVLHA